MKWNGRSFEQRFLSAVENCERKRLRMAAGSEKKHLGGNSMLKKLSKQRKMVLRRCCETGNHLICNRGIPRREKL